MVMDEIIKKIKKRNTYKMGKKKIQIIYDDDDAIIMTENENNLQREIKQFQPEKLKQK